MISNSVWNIGGNGYTGSAPYTLNLLTQYNHVRDIITYQNSRPTSWTGKVGLIYASDYGYASIYAECHNNLRNVLCKTDNWLFKNNVWYWTLSFYFGTPNNVFRVNGYGAIYNLNTYYFDSVFPSVYLKSDIKIISGTGEKGTPYRFE